MEYALLLSYIKKAQSGDLNAQDLILESLFEEMKKIAKKYAYDYSYIVDDESEFLYEIFQASLDAIRLFDESKGDFYHFWRLLISQRKIRLIKLRYPYKNMNSSHVSILSDSGDSIKQDNRIEFKDESEDIIYRSYLNDFREQVNKIMDEHFKPKDKKIIELWLQSYTLNEMCEILNMEYKKLVSRLYYLLKRLSVLLKGVDYI